MINWIKNLFCKDNSFTKEIERLNNIIKEKDNQIEILKNTEVKSPKELGTISYQEVNDILQNHCQNIYISDLNFLTTSMTEAKKFTEETKVWANQYKTEVYDCDNFSFSLMGYWSDSLKSFSFGIAWTSVHAFNFLIDNNKQVWIVEPQTNKYFKLEDVKSDKNYYPFRLALL